MANCGIVSLGVAYAPTPKRVAALTTPQPMVVAALPPHPRDAGVGAPPCHPNSGVSGGGFERVRIDIVLLKRKHME